jgi:F0F1-type ATP synthase membrane subunit b/b'
MSSIQEGLYPQKLLLLVQGGVFLCALVAGHVLIVRPAIRLQAERIRRTLGKRDSAAKIGLDVDRKTADYRAKMQAALEKARVARGEQIARGGTEAQRILQEAQSQAAERVQGTRAQVADVVRQERARLPELVGEVAKQIGDRLGVSLAALLVVGTFIWGGEAQASGGGVSMESTFWPYFQFVLYAAVAYWGGKKIIPPMLKARRDDLKRELDESRALLDAAEGRSRELEAKLAAAEKEIGELMEQYEAEGVRQAALGVEEARQLSEQLRQNAERIVKEAVVKGREDLRRELLELAIAEVERRIVGAKAEAVDVALKVDALQGVGMIAR